MKAQVYVEGHYAEASIDIIDIIQQMLDRRSEEEIRSVECAISDFYAFLKRVPDCVIAEMSDPHRAIIVSAFRLSRLIELSKRRTANHEITGIRNTRHDART